MRNVAMVVGATLLSACAAASNPSIDLAKEEQAVREASAKLSGAEAAKDLQGALFYWAPDAVTHMGGMPEVRGAAQMSEAYKGFFEHFPDKFESATKEVHVAASGDMAYEIGVNTFTYGTTVSHGKYLIVWKKVDGSWKAAAAGITDDAPPPAPSDKK